MAYPSTIAELAATVTAEELGKGFNLSVCPGPIAKQVQKVLSLSVREEQRLLRSLSGTSNWADAGTVA